MTAFAMRRLRGGLAVVVAVLLAACASAPTPQALQAGVATPARTPAPGAVAVTVSGGGETSAMDGPSISNADFQAAIEASLQQARAFEPAAAGTPPRYALGANIVRLTKPMFGLTFTVEFEVGWTLTDRRSGQVVWRKGITTSGTATTSDAFVGATRLRLAVEAAARANIEQLLREMPALSD